MTGFPSPGGIPPLYSSATVVAWVQAMRVALGLQSTQQNAYLESAFVVNANIPAGTTAELLGATGTAGTANVVSLGAGLGLASGILSNTGVVTFNTRAGTVTLSSGDVTAALGFTPGTVTNITAGLGITVNPSGGITTSATNDETIFPNAAPMITPTAKSTTLPLTANSLNSLKMLI